MPSYDYRCQKCRELFTVERSMTEDSAGTACEHCGSKDVSRIWNMYIRAKSASDLVGDSSSDSSTSGGCGSCCSTSCGSCC